MAEGVVAFETAEVIGGGPIREAMGIARGDVERMEDAQPPPADRGSHGQFHGPRSADQGADETS
jgi:hypothetical protein